MNRGLRGWGGVSDQFDTIWPVQSGYAPNFEEVEGAYWFGSVRAVRQSVSQSVCLSVMREHSFRNRLS